MELIKGQIFLRTEKNAKTGRNFKRRVKLVSFNRLMVHLIDKNGAIYSVPSKVFPRMDYNRSHISYNYRRDFIHVDPKKESELVNFDKMDVSRY